MSRPVGSASPSLTEVNFNEVESEPIMVPARSQSQPQGSQVERWSGQPPTMSFPAAERGPLLSGQDLAAQSAREAADRQSALKSLGELESPLAKLAQKYPDPISFFGNTQFKMKDVAFGAFGDALRDEKFERAASILNPRDVRASVEEQVKKAWPKSTPEQTAKLTQYFMGQIGESLRERVAPKLQAVATKMFEDTAAQFTKAANDPAKLQQLATRLTEMAHPLADPGEQAQVRDLRVAMGLDPDQANVTPEKLAAALNERAELLKEEAKKMKRHDRPTLFRALSDQEVGPRFMEAAGVRERSMLAMEIAAVKDLGESEKKTLEDVKLASLVSTAFVTTFLAPAGLAGTAVGVAGGTMFEAPGVIHAWEAIGTAKASESAGTMKAGAGHEAHQRAVIESAAAATSIAASTILGNAAHHVASNVGELAFMHAGIELAVGKSASAAGHAVGHALSSEGEGSGKNALERMKPWGLRRYWKLGRELSCEVEALKAGWYNSRPCPPVLLPSKSRMPIR